MPASRWRLRCSTTTTWRAINRITADLICSWASRSKSQRMRRLVGILTIVAAAVLLLEVSPGSAARGVSVPAGVPDDTLAIIVNQSNTIDDLSLKELRMVFL